MAEHERRRAVPQWAERERAEDLAWLGENLQGFWEAAQAGYTADGRGALVVDTTVAPGAVGHPFGYVTQAHIRKFGGRDEIRMVAAYDPTWEMVIILLKPRDRISTYHIGIPGRRPKPRSR